MATDTLLPPRTVPLLRDGDRMDRDEFERRWDAMPDLKHAELIEGVVHLMPAALSMKHGAPHFDLITLLGYYRLQTPGVSGADNASIRFDNRNMPQPDVILRIDDEHGGQSRIDADGYLDGGPELIAEIANSSKSRGLGVKKTVYQRNEVREYIVWRTQDKAIDWFILRGDAYVPLPPGTDGITRSEFFPGLWLDIAALLGNDDVALLRAAQLGIGRPEHAVFVQELARRAAAPK
jgi:hypothetical protein